MGMQVVALRRYPVKSMGGEGLDEVTLDERGVVGDRWYAVADAEGRFASGKDTRRFRRRDRVFDYAAETTGDAAVLVTRGDAQWRAGDPELDAELSRVMAAAVAVRAEDATPHHDAGRVSLVGTATLDWCARRWGIDADPRRLRVNLVLATTEPFVEETWVGRRLAVGDTVLEVDRRIQRCRTIDLDQDGATGEGRWLKTLGRERESNLAMYADVARPGVVRLGDEATLQ